MRPDGAVARAIAAGATAGEVVDVLVCVARTVGMAQLVAAAAPIALGLGVDVDRAFEELGDDGDVNRRH